MSDEFNLSPAQLDALREIGNVGAGNSATALSQVINKRIDMNVPKVALVPLENVPDLVGGPDVIVVGVFLRVHPVICKHPQISDLNLIHLTPLTHLSAKRPDTLQHADHPHICLYIMHSDK